MSASIPGCPVFRSLVAAALGVSLLAGAVGCGGSSNNTNVPLPPGGVAIGNLACSGAAEPPTSSVAQGQTVNVRFRLIDVNGDIPAIGVPVSFDVIGGTLLPPPNATDGNGVVIVTFVPDPGFVGAARVRLIGPEARLDCDVSFTVFQSAPVLRAEVLDGANAVVTALDACGSFETNVERQEVRRIRYTVTRPNPVTGAQEPAAGELVRLQATGLTFNEAIIGPTDANGQVVQEITPFATGVGTATVVANVVRQDLDGPAGAPDGVPDTLPSNTCTIRFGIINPICDADGGNAAVVYRDAFGAPKGAPLRPGESATVTANFTVDGTPQANRTILVDAADGFINGSAVPVQVQTDGAGNVSVTYTAQNGFSGTDVVTFQDDVGTLQCTQTANIEVVTCDITLEFLAPVCSGCTVPTIVRVLNVDPATALGEVVAVDVVGGAFTVQPPTGVLAPDGMGVPSFTTTLNITPGFSGPAALSLSFISGYACNSVTEGFVVP